MSALLSILLEVLLKLTALLVVALIADRVLLATRSSAAARHLLWATTLVGSLALPFFAFGLPGWNVLPQWRGLPAAEGSAARHEGTAPAMVRTAERAQSNATPNEGVATGSPVVTAVTEPAAPLRNEPAPSDAAPRAARTSLATSLADDIARLPWKGLLAALYFTGVFTMLARVAVEQRAVRRLARGASRLEDSEWNALLQAAASGLGIRRRVTLLQSEHATIPLTWGVREHVVLVPEGANEWPAARRRAVLVHELAHVARQDCLTGTLAVIACAVYWPHPGVWYAAHRLRVERELACDDQVLQRGISAYDYAGHLLAIARAARAAWSPTALAVPMATPSNLELRMRAAIDRTRVRTAPGPSARVATSLVCAALLMPLASLHARDDVRADETVQATPASPNTSDTRRTTEHASATSTGAVPTSPTRGDTVGVNMRATARANDSTIVASSAPSTARAPGVAASITRALDSIVSAGAGFRESAALSASMVQSRYTGSWFMRPASRSEAPDGTPSVHVMFNTNGINTFTIAAAKLEGLTGSQRAAATADVKFTLRRDPGTFHLVGTFSGGEGKGTFEFVPDSSFANALVARGMARPTGQQLFSMAKHGVGFDLLDELKRQGYAQPTTYMLDRVGMTSVDVEYLRKMDAIGYRFGTVERAIGLSNHSIDADYIAAQNARTGRRLTADQVMAVKQGRYLYATIAGTNTPIALPVPNTDNTTNSGRAASANSSTTPVSGRWIIMPVSGGGTHLELRWDDDNQWKRMLGTAEVRSLPSDKFTSANPVDLSFRFDQDAGRFDFIGGARNGRGEGRFEFTVKREFVNTLRSLGISDLENITDHDLKNLAFSSISAAAIREFQALGVAPMSRKDLVDLAVRIVSPEYARAMIGFGVTDAKAAWTLAELKFVGMQPEYVGDLAATGYRGLSSEQLIAMRRAGVTGAFIRALRDAGTTGLSAEELIERAMNARRR